jgi:O-succinylbenzoate synthase
MQTFPVSGGASLNLGSLERAKEIEIPIRLRRADLFMLSLPMCRTFKSAYGASTGMKRAILVRLEDDDGTVGWGEAPAPERPVYCADTPEGTWSVLTDLILPGVMARTFSGPSQLAETWEDLLGQHYAKHAAESAAWAIASEKIGVPLASLWGGVRTRIPVGESFSIYDSVELLLDEIALRLQEGFSRIKLKIAPGWDVSVVSAVKNAFPGSPLSVDANCGYTVESGPWEELDDFDLLMIEQPLPGDALIELSTLQSNLRTPICLDESATGYNMTRTALRLGAGRIVNIKPPRLGGFLECFAVHDLCVDLEIPAWCGGTLETGIGRGFNLALASLPGFTMHADMSPARIFYEEDLVEPTFDIELDGCISVPLRPGNGFPVVPERVERFAIRKWSIGST